MRNKTGIMEKTLKRVQGDKLGFTLAEVLITIGIIGIVAVVTIPNLVRNYETRSWNTSASNFERKLGEALRVMNAQGMLSSYNDTKDFIENGLSKQMSILKVCDEIEECFPEKIMEKENKSLDSTTLDTSESLGHGEFETEAIAVQFLNGINAIISYNKNFYTTNDADVVTFNKESKDGREYVNITTNAISMLYDVTGFEKPNMLGKDLRSVNSSLGGDCTKIGDYYCITNVGSNYDILNCSYSDIYSEYCGNYTSTKVAWAGANKACAEIGMRVASKEDFPKLYVLKDLYNGIPKDGIYIVGEEYTTSNYQTYNFSKGQFGSALAHDSSGKVLCVSD